MQSSNVYKKGGLITIPIFNIIDTGVSCSFTSSQFFQHFLLKSLILLWSEIVLSLSNHTPRKPFSETRAGSPRMFRNRTLLYSFFANMQLAAFFTIPLKVYCSTIRLMSSSDRGLCRNSAIIRIWQGRS